MSKKAIYFGSLEDVVPVTEQLQEQQALNLVQEQSYNNLYTQQSQNEQAPTDPHTAQFTERALGKTLKIPTEDSSVRSLLVSLNQPITLFGEGPAERRDRLRFMAAKAITSLPRAFQLFPCLKSLTTTTTTTTTSSASVNSKSTSDSDESDEEFYVPGSVDLVKTRSFLLDDSIKRACQFRKPKVDKIHEQTLRTRLYADIKNYVQLKGTFIDAQGRPLSGCAFASQGLLFTADWSGRIIKYQNGQGNLFTGLSDRISAFTSNSSLLLATGTATGKIFLLPTSTNDTNLIIPRPNAQITDHAIKSLDFHPSHQFIASASGDSCWRLWDLNRMTSDSFSEAPLQVQEGHVKGISSATWHPHGSLYCTGGTQDGLIRVWDCRLGKAIWTISQEKSSNVTTTISALNFSPLMPNVLASANSDGILACHDLRKLDAHFIKVAAHRSSCSEIKFAKEGRLILTAGFDGFVRMWAPGDLRLVNELVLSANSKISAMDTAEEGDHLKIAAVSLDRSVKIFSNNNNN